MANLRLAGSLIAYTLCFSGLLDSVGRRVHWTLGFFTPEGSLLFGLGSALSAALLTVLFRLLERRQLAAGLASGFWAATTALAWGLLLGATLYGVVVLLEWAIGFLSFGGIRPHDPSRLSLFLASLARNPGVAFGEELAFRGQVLGRLSERVGFGAAAGLSSLLYAGFHYGGSGFGPAGFVGLSLLGLLLAGLVRRTGALWASMGFHASWNFVQGGVFGLSMVDAAGQGHGLVAVEQFGPVALVGSGLITEGGLLPMAVLAAGAALALWPPRETSYVRS
jgi:membrane protease YdiL (CAAX protease family)